MLSKIYSNTNVTDTLDSMILSGRVPHAFLIFGERGLGKKTIAANLAERIIMMGQTTKKPINSASHPDIIWVEHTGKRLGFSVEIIKKVCSDAYIIPNNGDKKVYIFTDCDSIDTRSQNTLLKIIEEPPEFAHFILTSQSKSVFLPTIISRVISLGVSECKIDECRTALTEKGFSAAAEIDAATEAFGGNIGMCIDFLTNDELKKHISLVKEISKALSTRSEYAILKAFAPLESGRPLAKSVLELLKKVIRDSAVKKCGTDQKISCCRNESDTISVKYTIGELEKIFEIINKTILEIDSNINMGVEMAAICGRICDL
ncbi:MAG: hypothetical protein RR540_06085 [Oscillospiraceae bacterium]